MNIDTESDLKRKNIITPRLSLVAWEITRRCNLFCAHCRASATDTCYRDELATDECLRLIDGITEVGSPILILTGGEPLMREDVFQLGKYAVRRGLKVVMGTNGTMITGEIAGKLKEVPVTRVGVSLDFPTAPHQDDFRGKEGAFRAALSGIENARKAGIEVQINCTVTRLNVGYLEDLLKLALEAGAVAFHPFMLVPTGRGKGLETVELSPAQYEETLNWIYDRQAELGERLFFKPTDAPHYLRIRKQRDRAGGNLPPAAAHGHAITRGCLAGTGFCFISHRGRVQGCGYLDIEAGNIRENTFSEVWNGSRLFNELRDLDNIKGKCGACEYKRLCGGCRARAYEATGDYLEAEPYCVYQPAGRLGCA